VKRESTTDAMDDSMRVMNASHLMKWVVLIKHAQSKACQCAIAWDNNYVFTGDNYVWFMFCKFQRYNLQDQDQDTKNCLILLFPTLQYNQLFCFTYVASIFSDISWMLTSSIHKLS